MDLTDGIPLLERYAVVLLPALVVAEQVGIPVPAVPALLIVGALAAKGRVSVRLVIGLSAGDLEQRLEAGEEALPAQAVRNHARPSPRRRARAMDDAGLPGSRLACAGAVASPHRAPRVIAVGT